MISIQKPYTDNIHRMLKRAELRKSIPKSPIASAAANKPIYALNITQSAFYASPRPLSDFGLTRAPQSWCYIKEVA